MKSIQELTKELEEILLPRGFCRIGKIFYKVQEGTILWIIRFRGDGLSNSVEIIDENNVSVHPHYTLEFGLESLFSKIRPYEFTAGGCVTRYFMVNLIGENASQDTLFLKNHGISFEFTPETQLHILMDKGLPFMESITSQEMLLDAMIHLDMTGGRHENIHGWEKYAPFLYTEKYEEAGWIARNALWVRKIPSIEWDNLEKVISYGASEDKKQELITFYNYMRLADRKNREECLSFMRNNYLENVKKLRRKSKHLI